MSSWYEESFGQDYLLVYKHRDIQGAQSEVRKMTDWLHLREGAEILDLCCGMGRHSLALVESGYRMTGMDLSDVLLAEARRMDEREQVSWIKGDMRSIPLEGPFDAVVNLFTSFGYFDNDSENAAVLREIGRVLKPGGRFILDYLNPGYVVKNLVPASERNDGETIIREKRSIEEGCVRKRIIISEPGSPDRHYLEQVKLYGLKDFGRLLEGSGLTVDAVYGNYSGEPFDIEQSQRLILVGTRAEATSHE